MALSLYELWSLDKEFRFLDESLASQKEALDNASEEISELKKQRDALISEYASKQTDGMIEISASRLIGLLENYSENLDVRLDNQKYLFTNYAGSYKDTLKEYADKIKFIKANISSDDIDFVWKMSEDIGKKLGLVNDEILSQGAGFLLWKKKYFIEDASVWFEEDTKNLKSLANKYLSIGVDYPGASGDAISEEVCLDIILGECKIRTKKGAVDVHSKVFYTQNAFSTLGYAVLKNGVEYAGLAKGLLKRATKTN